MEFWVLGGDARNYWAAVHLAECGHTVRCFGVPDAPDTPLPFYIERLVLPFPSYQGALVRGHSAIPMDEVLQHVDADSTVYGGLLGAWREALEHHGARVRDLYGTEPLTTANAIPTAEGAIQLAMDHAPITLHGAQCLVIGFGRIGKILARKLHGLSANVTVAARRPTDLALAEAMGLQTDLTGKYIHGLSQYDFIFNTVPASVLTEKQLNGLAADCLLMELASLPGGFSQEYCRAHQISYIFAPGLPGRCAPKSAGRIYAQNILDDMQREETA
ncbi:MAG: hypothetical protein IJG45_08950 [Oscillospiraceae bacterium]|nr:hypothetical protein [Oscillospiraceae bacterium]